MVSFQTVNTPITGCGRRSCHLSRQPWPVVRAGWCWDPQPTSSSRKAARSSWQSRPERHRDGRRKPATQPVGIRHQRRQRRASGGAGRFRPEHHGIGSIPHQQPGEPVADPSGRGAERAQPATHRRDRPSALGRDPPVARPQRGLRLDGRRDHLGGVGSPRGQPHLQQHMRAPAAHAPRSARPKPPADPIRAEALPNDTRPGPPPRAQSTPAPRAGHPPGREVQLDRNKIMTYREHQRGLYASERPGVILQDPTPGRSSIRTSSA